MYSILLKFSCFNTYKQAGLLKIFLEHLKTQSTFAILILDFLETDPTREMGSGIFSRYIQQHKVTVAWKWRKNWKVSLLWISETPVRAEKMVWISSSFFPYYFLDRVAFFIPSRANQTITGRNISKLIDQIFAAGFVGWLPSTCMQNLRVKLSTSTWMQMIIRVKWIDTSKS